MNIFVASVSSATSPTGVCRHAANIVRGLLSLEQIDRVILCVGKWQESYFRESFDLHDPRLEVKAVDISNTSVSRNIWYLKDLPRLARQYDADIVHLAYPAPVLRKLVAAPLVVSLHDLYPYDIPENFAGHAYLNRIALHLCIRNVAAIAAVSAQTRDKLHKRFLDVSPFRTAVIPNSVHLAAEAIPSSLPKEVRNAPFLLCVAQHRINKNIPRLLRGFHHALIESVLPVGTKLAIVGREGPETRKILREAQMLGLTDRIVLLSGIADPMLASLYKHCLAVAAPSLIEGFGLPVAEALSFGCRIIASDIEAFRSIDDGSCVWFDPYDDSGQSFSKGMRLLLSLRKDLRPRRHLRPEESAQQYLRLYSDLIDGMSVADNYSAPSAPQREIFSPIALLQNSPRAEERSR